MLEPESRLGEALGAGLVETASHHHQAIARLGSGLRVVARAEDGTIEAVEDSERHFVIGVLWHPEVGDDSGLFRSLIVTARARAVARP